MGKFKDVSIETIVAPTTHTQSLEATLTNPKILVQLFDNSTEENGTLLHSAITQELPSSDVAWLLSHDTKDKTKTVGRIIVSYIGRDPSFEKMVYRVWRIIWFKDIPFVYAPYDYDGLVDVPAFVLDPPPEWQDAAEYRLQLLHGLEHSGFAVTFSQDDEWVIIGLKSKDTNGEWVVKMPIDTFWRTDEWLEKVMESIYWWLD